MTDKMFCGRWLKCSKHLWADVSELRTQEATKRAVLQKLLKACKRHKHLCLFSLGRHCEQTGDEQDVAQDVPFFDATHLPFPDHVHHLVAAARVRHAVSKEKKPIPGMPQAFDEAVILLN
jgi:hypothetical protein